MKKLYIILGVIVAIIIGAVAFVSSELKPASKEDIEKTVTFTVSNGDTKLDIVNNLKAKGLIKNKYVALFYIIVTSKTNLQAGTYELTPFESTPDVINHIANGDIIDITPTIRVKFIEGQTLEDYSKLIANNFTITQDDVLKKAKDEEYLKSLIDKYWFIDESILDKNIYYGLEGYLAADTYEFYVDASLDDIFTKLLNNMDKRLETYKDEIEKSGFTVHEILSMASVIEKEGNTTEDRLKISQVLHTRLESNMSLGCDVTTYYAVHKNMKQALTLDDLNSTSLYNTRGKNMEGRLPIGPICMLSEDAIIAALRPSKTNYMFFIADVETSTLYFYETYNDFAKKKQELGL